MLPTKFIVISLLLIVMPPVTLADSIVSTLHVDPTVTKTSDRQFSITRRPYNNQQLAEVRYRQAIVRLKANDSRQAISLFTQAMELFPRHENAAFALAVLHINNADRRAAIDNLQHLVRVNPSHAQARKLLAGLLLRDKHQQHMRQHLNKLTPARQDLEWQSISAYASLQTGDYAAALQRYSELSRQHPQSMAFRLGLALSHELLQQTAQARVGYKQLMQQNLTDSALKRFITRRLSRLDAPVSAKDGEE